MALALLAVEEFNKQKNAQLQLVRAVKAYCQIYELGLNEEYYYLTLEAVDAEVVKTYQALVCEDSRRGLVLSMFGLVADNATRSFMKLIDEHYFYGALDIRDDQPGDGVIIRESSEIQAAVQTREGYALKDEILDSLHALPFQQS